MTGGTVQDFLVIDQITKSFDVTRAVDSVSITVEEGEVFSLLGPSGCGKTTLLRLLAGFVKPESGRLILNGADITDLPPEKRPVNTVFQNYALFPHLTVRENIAFGLQMAGRSQAYIGHAVEDMLTLVKLQEHIHHLPAQLSGGQKQRVAIARALVNKPQVLLLDEPLAALDLKLRQHMLSELSAIHREVGTTFIYVTHDQGEALSLSDRIAVMNHGHVEQIDTPTALYEKPINEFVAGFIGDANLLLGIVRHSSEDHFARVEIAGWGDVFIEASPELQIGQRANLMLRPEHVQCCLEKPEIKPGVNAFPATVEEIIYGGAHERLILKSGQRILQVQRIRHGAELPLKVGMHCWLTFEPKECRLIC